MQRHRLTRSVPRERKGNYSRMVKRIPSSKNVKHWGAAISGRHMPRKDEASDARAKGSTDIRNLSATVVKVIHFRRLLLSLIADQFEQILRSGCKSKPNLGVYADLINEI